MAGICVSFVFISNAVRCVKATVVHERPVSLVKGPNRAALFYPAIATVKAGGGSE